MTKLGKLVRDARRKKRFSLRDVELKTHHQITNSYLCKIEKDNHTVSPLKLKVLAQVLDVPYIELLLAAKHITPSQLKG